MRARLSAELLDKKDRARRFAVARTFNTSKQSVYKHDYFNIVQDGTQMIRSIISSKTKTLGKLKAARERSLKPELRHRKLHDPEADSPVRISPLHSDGSGSSVERTSQTDMYSGATPLNINLGKKYDDMEISGRTTNLLNDILPKPQIKPITMK